MQILLNWLSCEKTQKRLKGEKQRKGGNCSDTMAAHIESLFEWDHLSTQDKFKSKTYICVMLTVDHIFSINPILVALNNKFHLMFKP